MIGCEDLQGPEAPAHFLNQLVQEDHITIVEAVIPSRALTDADQVLISFK